MTLFSSSNFSTLLFVTFIFAFENSQNSFSCGPTLGSFWSVKYLNFGQRLSISTAHHTFLESRHPEVGENPYYVLSPEGSQKKDTSSWTINITKIFHLINSKNLLGGDSMPQRHLAFEKFTY